MQKDKTLSNLGFKLESGGAHLSRTIMLDELEKLFELVPRAASKNHYAAVIVALAALQLIHYQGYLLGGQLLVSAYIGILLWLLQPRRSDLHFLGFWGGAIALQAVLMLVLSS